MKNFAIDYTRLRGHKLTIDYFSLSHRDVAQTSVLIGVNPCLTESNLKKQSQFSKG